MSQDLSEFRNRVAFITGAGTGIGRTFARALIGQGAAVVIADIDGELAQRTTAELQAEGGRALDVQCDVADEAGVDDAVAQSVAAFGGIDLLINNAARHLLEYNVPCTELSRDKWREMLAVNVVGMVNCTAACVDTMRERGAGAVVNLASIAGRRVRSPYGVSKLAVRGLTVALAYELGVHGIRVNCIAPGTVDSEAVQEQLSEEHLTKRANEEQVIKRPGRMEDLVGAMFFLASDSASFITGETISVSGGYPLFV